MGTTTKVILGSFIALILIIGGTVAYVISAKFTSERYEQSILAQDEQMRNVHSELTKGIMSMAQTVKSYTKSDLEKMKVAIARYEGKPNMMMQWAQEQGNKLSPDLHKQLMLDVKTYYAKFENTQKTKISVSQEYRTFINASVKGMIAGSFFNYPTQKAQTIMDKIVQTADTKEVIDTGVDKAVDLKLN